MIIAQDVPHIIQYHRQEKQWVRQDIGDLKGLLQLTSIDAEILISEIYDGITFD